MHEAIQAALDPLTALSLGLKVDADVLPEGILEQVDLEDPATTVALIGMNAVVGMQGTVDSDGNLTSVGITCALCHSDVNNSVMDGIGSRIDGAANRDLDPGAIIALAPGLAESPDIVAIYNSWGPGYYDPRFNQDMINHPVLIPRSTGSRTYPSRRTRATGRFRIGTRTSASRRWAASGTSTIRASASGSSTTKT